MNCFGCGEGMDYIREPFMVVRGTRLRRLENVGKWHCSSCDKKVLGYEYTINDKALLRWESELSKVRV